MQAHPTVTTQLFYQRFSATIFFPTISWLFTFLLISFKFADIFRQAVMLTVHTISILWSQVRQTYGCSLESPVNKNRFRICHHSVHTESLQKGLDIKSSSEAYYISADQRLLLSSVVKMARNCRTCCNFQKETKNIPVFITYAKFLKMFHAVSHWQTDCTYRVLVKISIKSSGLK